MSIILNDNLDTQFNKPLDTRFGAYADISTALEQVPLYRRYIGLTIGIGTNPVVEYWFNDGIQDSDLVLKTPDINYPVTSVNGKTGAVVLDKTDVGLGNVDNTSDANKPISTATQTALDGKASTTSLNAHTSDLNNPHSVTKSQVGLGNVDNTSDLNKPISTATQTALNLKQDSLGFTPENIANKSISVITDQASNTKYPSVKSVYDWATGLFATITQLGTKQDTLVSGTNIKTVNSNSLVGSGDVVIDKTSIGLGNVVNVDTTNASNISSGTLSDTRLSTNVTIQGNTFNAANKLVQLDATAKLPAVDGSQLTNLPSFTPPSGLLKIASAISTTFQVVKDYLDNASVLFLNSRRIGIGKDTSVTTQSVAVVEVQDANTSIVLKPNGTGGIIASVPDGTATGGNARGSYAVDLQMVRTSNDQVASGLYSFNGGYGSISSGQASFSFGNISGGNSSTSTGQGSVAIGNGNRALATGAVAMGSQSFVTGTNSIGMGLQTNVTANNAVAFGPNVVSSQYSTISGGQSNTASTNTHATVVGGQSNTASGQWSLAGGQSSVASGTRSVALGAVATASAQQSFAFGLNTTVQGYGSVGIGHYAQTGTSADLAFASGSGRSYLYNQMSHGNYWFTDGGNANFGSRQLSQLLPYRESALTTAATMLLSLDGTGTTNLIIPLGNNRAWNVTIDTIAVVTAITGTATGVSVGDCYRETKQLLFKRIGGTSSIVGTVDTSAIKSDSGMSTASITISAGASQQMALTFTAPTFAGGGSVTCRVVSKVSLVEVAY